MSDSQHVNGLNGAPGSGSWVEMSSACCPGLPEVVHAVEWFARHRVVSPDQLQPAARGFFHLNGRELVVTEHPLELRKSESLWYLNGKHSTDGETNQHFKRTCTIYSSHNDCRIL